jgi:hypothetical protein
MGEMKKVGNWFGSATRAHGMAARPEGWWCRWVPEVGDYALVGRTGSKGRVEQAGFIGSEGEMKMGRATKWAES